jgi:stage II sporulation SpoAA-like protein
MYDGDTDIIACIGPIVVLVVDNFTPAGAAALGRAMAQLVERHSKISSLSVVERKVGPSIDADGRKAVADLSTRYTHHITGTAVVCEGTGFRATAIRSIVTAVRMASRASHPQKVFATVEEAVAWLAPMHVGGVHVPTALQSITLLRARLQERLARSGVQSTR